MRRIRLGVLATVWMTSLLLGISVQTHAAPSDAVLISVAGSWANALRTGNVGQLEALAAGDLLADRRALWRSAGFAEELQQTYANAAVSVDEIRKGGNGASLVRIRVQFTGGLPMYRQLTIVDADGKGRYRVIDDSPATD